MTVKQRLFAFCEKHRTFLLYAVYGIPPTLVSFGGYLLLLLLPGCPAFAASGISWFAALILSFVLYRKFVFRSGAAGFWAVLREFIRFVSLRITSGLAETGFVWLFVDCLGRNKLLFKVAASILAALFNYMISLLFVFRSRRD